MNRSVLRRFVFSVLFGALCRAGCPAAELSCPVAALSCPAAVPSLALNGEPISERITFGNPVLNRFADELGRIPADRPECLTQAVARYEEIFSPVPSLENDSAYLILEDFVVFCIRSVNFNVPLSEMASGAPGTKYRRNLERNYFIVKEIEGVDLRVEADLYALQNRLKDYLTPSALNFMRAVEEESAEADNTSDLSPERLAERACFWDSYIDGYPQSVFWEEAYERRDACLDALIFGTENYPLFTDGDGATGSLIHEDFKKVFLRLSKEYENGIISKTRQVVHDFNKILQEHGYRDCMEVSCFTF